MGSIETAWVDEAHCLDCAVAGFRCTASPRLQDEAGRESSESSPVRAIGLANSPDWLTQCPTVKQEAGRGDRQSTSRSLDCAWDCRLLGFVLPVARIAQTPGLSLRVILGGARLALQSRRSGRSPAWRKMKGGSGR